MKEVNILVSNSKLRLVKTNFGLGDTSYYLDELLKGVMLFQEIYYISDDDKCKIFDTSGKVGTLSVPSGNFKESWVLVEGSEKNSDKIKYDVEDLRIIRSVLSVIVSKHIKVAEILCRVLPGAQNAFYSNYGSKLCSVFNGKIKKPSEKERYPLVYQGTRRYGVYDFINDLSKEDAVSILIDSSLIGRYVKMSRAKKPAPIVFKDDEWSMVVGKRGNRCRANISLVIRPTVEVTVPENEFGVEPGKRELKAYRSICIIKDGTLHTRYLAVKGLSNALIGKMKRIGAVVDDLLMPGEYLFDLSKLPIVNRNYTRRLSSEAVFMPEIKGRLNMVAASYVSCLMWKARLGLSSIPKTVTKDDSLLSDSTKFLHSLGIYGDVYHDPSTSVTDKIEYSYTSFAFERRLVGMPVQYFSSIRNFINTGTCKNQIYCKLFKKVDAMIASGKYSLEDLHQIYLRIAEEYFEQVSDVNFRLILSKSLKMTDKGSPNLENHIFTLLVLGEPVQARVKFNDITVKV